VRCIQDQLTEKKFSLEYFLFKVLFLIDFKIILFIVAMHH